MSKRKYTKKSDYWDQFKDKDLNELIQETRGEAIETWDPVLAGEAYYTQNIKASYERSGQGNSSEHLAQKVGSMGQPFGASLGNTLTSKKGVCPIIIISPDVILGAL